MRKKNKRVRKGIVVLATAILSTSFYSVAAEERISFSTNTKGESVLTEATVDGADLSLEKPVKDSINSMNYTKLPMITNNCNTLGNCGYYIINGIDMVDAGGAYYTGGEKGVCEQTKNGKRLLCTDNAHNLNYGENKLYFTTKYSEGTYIKIIDTVSAELVQTYELPGWEIKQMYLVNNEELMFLAGGCIFSLDLDTQEILYHEEYDAVFSFIPTRKGIVYAQGEVQDYTLYVEECKVGEHVSDYYMEDDILVYTMDGVEYRLGYNRMDYHVMFTKDFDYTSTYTTQSWFQDITTEDFLKELSQVIPEEETNVVFSEGERIDTTPTEEGTVILSTAQFAKVYTPGEACDSEKLIPAKVTKEQKAIANRAKEIYNDTWTTLGRVKRWNELTDAESSGCMLDEGVEVHGIVYSQAVNNGKFVLSSGGMSWEEYKKERAKKDSVLYSEKKEDWSWGYVTKGGKQVQEFGPKYGCDCSTFASYCWDLEKRTTTVEIGQYGVDKNTDVEENDKNKWKKFIKIQVGDILNKEKSHVVVISDIKYNQEGNIAEIEVTEQTVPYTRQKVYKGLDALWDSKDNYGNYTLYRLKSIQGTTLALDKTNCSCYEKDTIQLAVTGAPGGKLTWKSSNSSVASVDKEGLVTAKKAGTAVITATLTVNGLKQTAKCKVAVTKKSLTMKSKMTIYPGYPEQLTAKTIPNTDIAWSSGNSAIATVKDGLVTGIKPGTVKITAKANGITKICTVTVKACTIKMKKKEQKMYQGETLQLEAVTTPAWEAVYCWESSNETVAMVDEKGMVTAVKAGKTEITAKLKNGKKATCKIQVKKPSFIMNTNLSVYMGQTKEITASTRPETKIVWTSDNPQIATVDKQGRVTGVAVGKTKITGVANGVTRTCNIKILKPTLTISPSKLTVYKGYTGKIKATPLPDANVEWNSLDTSIVKVDTDGTVEGLKAGKVVVTAKAHGLLKKCTVTVKNPTLKLSSASLEIGRGETKKIKATVQPQSASVIWSSSNTLVAAVGEDGTITGLKLGTAIIKAQAHGLVKTCAVTVLEPSFSIETSAISLYQGKTRKITASVRPDAAIRWESSNEQVAKVDEKGIVTGVKAGVAVISAEAHGITRTCEVTVKKPTLTVKKTDYKIKIGKTDKISAYTAPAANIQYRSLRPNTVSVDSKGKIKGLQRGVATIVVSANGCYEYVFVTVVD